MRRPPNSILRDTTEKPYNNESYDIMKKTTSNKQIEDVGGVTKHSEFEKPYKLSPTENYQNMQTLHPSNYDISFLFPSSPNWENPFDEGVTGGGVTGGGVTGGGSKTDRCKELLKNCQFEGMFGTACGKAMAAGCLRVIGNCMQFNWTGETSYDDARCFCEKCGGNCDQQYSEKCVTGACEKENCPSFTLEGSDTAPTTLYTDNAVCIVSVEGAVQNDKDVNEFYVADEGCGTKQVCVTDMCGTMQCKDVKMSIGTWNLMYIIYPPYHTGGTSDNCNIGSQAYNVYSWSGAACGEYYNALQYLMDAWNIKSPISGAYPPCEFISCNPYTFVASTKVSNWICP